MTSTAFKILVTSFLFVLSVSLYAQDYPPNDECDDAIVLECGDTVVGHIANAREDNIVYNFNNSNLYPGIWYTINSDSLIYQIDIDSASSKAVAMAIFREGCQDTDIVDLTFPPIRLGNDEKVNILFFQHVDESSSRYVDSIFVSLTCISQAPPNDECNNAYPIVSNTRIYGSLNGALPSFKCGWHGPDVFYSFVGNDSLVKFTFDNEDFHLGASFHRNCHRLPYACLNSNQIGKSWYLPTQKDSTYLISLTGTPPLTEGDFTFSYNSVNDNSSCEDAIPLVESTRIGSFNKFEQHLTDCNLDYSGEWYDFTPEKDTLVVFTSNFRHTQLDVFKGNDCNSLECVTLTQEIEPFYFTFTYKQSFLAKEGESYKIRIAMLPEQYRVYLALRSRTSGNLCETAIDLSNKDTIGYNIKGALRYTTPCYDSDKPTIWYKAEILDSNTIITITADDDYLDLYETDFNIYQGDCESLKCVNTGVHQRDFSFLLPQSGTYFFSISSNKSYDGTITIERVESISNDICSKATLLNSGEGDTLILNSLDSVPNSCLSEPPYLATAWYKYIGDGNTALFQTNEHEYSPRVFKGGCGALECVDYYGSNGYYHFDTQQDSTYYLSIHGVVLNEVRILLESSEIRPNSICEYAMEVQADSLYNVEFAYAVLDSTCSGRLANKNWFVLEGNDSIITVSLNGLLYDNEFEVWEGQCEVLNCIGLFEDMSSFKTERGQKYFITPISRWNLLPYTLTTQSSAAALNNNCDNALFLERDTTIELNILNYGYTSQRCASTTNPDIWYKALGDGNLHSMRLLSNDNSFSSYVYTSLQVDTMTCDEKDVECIRHAAIGADARLYLFEENKEYKIRVSPVYDYPDSLIFVHTVHTLPEHRLLQNARQISCSDSVILDSIDFALVDSEYSDYRELWYRIEGNNSIFSAHLNYKNYDPLGVHAYRLDDDDQLVTHGDNYPYNKDISFYANLGTTYYLKVYKYNAYGHQAFSIGISCESIAPNHRCDIAGSVLFHTNREFNIFPIVDHGFTADIVSECHIDDYKPKREYWYQLTTPHKGKFVFDSKNTQSAELYRGDCDNLELISCETIGIANGKIKRLVSDTLIGSTNYFLRVIASPRSIKDSIEIAFFDYHDYLTGDREHALELILGDEECEDNEIFSDLFNRNDPWVKIIGPSSGIVKLSMQNHNAIERHVVIDYQSYVNDENHYYDAIFPRETNSLLAKNMGKNDTLLIHFERNGSNWGANICAQEVIPAINDEQADAIQLIPMDQCSRDTFNTCYTNSTNLLGPECNQDPKHKFGDLWFKVKTNCEGTIKIELYPFSQYNPLFIQTYDPSNNSFLKCQRVERSSNNVFINEDLQPNQDYLIRIEEVDINSYRNHCSDFSICAVEVPATKYPIVSKLVGPQAVCPDETITITYEVTEQIDALRYKWTYDDTTVVTTTPQMTLVPSLKNLSSGITVVGINHCGESDPVHMDITIPSPSHCALSSCLRTNTYIDNSLLHILDQLDVYRAAESIQSDATIESAYAKYFKAGEDVTLYPNFEVKKGATFVADIESCIDTLDNRP